MAQIRLADWELQISGSKMIIKRSNFNPLGTWWQTFLIHTGQQGSFNLVAVWRFSPTPTSGNIARWYCCYTLVAIKTAGGKARKKQRFPTKKEGSQMCYLPPHQFAQKDYNDDENQIEGVRFWVGTMALLFSTMTALRFLTANTWTTRGCGFHFCLQCCDIQRNLPPDNDQKGRKLKG